MLLREVVRVEGCSACQWRPGMTGTWEGGKRVGRLGDGPWRYAESSVGDAVCSGKRGYSQVTFLLPTALLRTVTDWWRILIYQITVKSIRQGTAHAASGGLCVWRGRNKRRAFESKKYHVTDDASEAMRPA